MQAMNWRWVIADASASLLFLVISLMFLYGAGFVLGNGPNGFSATVKSVLALFVGAADGSIDSSMVLSKVAPQYPEIAKKMHITGTVEVDVIVDDSGKVTDVKAVNGPAMLRASAEAAIKQWKFKPGGGKGKVAVNFGN
jgi:TonB family protein